MGRAFGHGRDAHRLPSTLACTDGLDHATIRASLNVFSVPFGGCNCASALGSRSATIPAETGAVTHSAGHSGSRANVRRSLSPASGLGLALPRSLRTRCVGLRATQGGGTSDAALCEGSHSRSLAAPCEPNKCLGIQTDQLPFSCQISLSPPLPPFLSTLARVELEEPALRPRIQLSVTGDRRQLGRFARAPLSEI